MRVLVYGAGVLGSQFAVRLQDAGHEVELVARGDRLASLRQHGVQIARARDAYVRRVVVPVVERPAGVYDLILVLVRTHQVAAVLESVVDVGGDVLFLHNWAAGPEPLGAVIGHERVLLGFPASGAGVMDGDIVRPRPATVVERLARMPIGEPDGRTTPRLERIVRAFRAAGMRAKAEPRMDDRLRTHAAFEVPLGQAVHEAGGPVALAEDRAAVREMVQRVRRSLGAMRVEPVPRAFGVLQILPEDALVAVFRRFLAGPLAGPLGTVSPAAIGEYERLAEQLAAG